MICDEHQDATFDQHELIAACLKAGSRVRIFGDPMQAIYATSKTELKADGDRWATLRSSSDSYEELDIPHRWLPKSKTVGEWIRRTRIALRDGGQVDLRNGLPDAVSFIVAENTSADPRRYSLSGEAAKQVYSRVNKTTPLLILAPHNETVRALRALFNRSIPIWEGHMRTYLQDLTDSVTEHQGSAPEIGAAICTFLENVAVGCSPSALGKTFIEEIQSGCKKTRSGKPGAIQSLSRLIPEQPNHIGAGNALKRLSDLAKKDTAFQNVALDHSREFWDAIRLVQFETAEEGLAEMARRRTILRPLPAVKTISTIHKAKGLECGNVIVMPCDRKHFGDSQAARLKLYVARSRPQLPFPG